MIRPLLSYLYLWIFSIILKSYSDKRKDNIEVHFEINLTDTGGDSKVINRRTSKGGHAIFFSFFQRFRATSMTQGRVENTRVHFWTFSPVSVNFDRKFYIRTNGYYFYFVKNEQLKHSESYVFKRILQYYIVSLES